MCKSAEIVGYSTRGALAKDLFVAVRSTLPPVADLLRLMPNFSAAPGPVAADIEVVEDPAAPRKRFLLPEYYTRIEWQSETRAHVETNGATGSITWSGHENHVLEASCGFFRRVPRKASACSFGS